MQNKLGSEGRPVSSANEVNSSDYTSATGAWARRRRCAPRGRLFFAIFLIGAGTLLFLCNIGVLPIHNIWDFWPLILIAIGVAKLSHRTVSELLGGVLLALFGVLFLLLTLHVFSIRAWDGSWPFSLLLIAFGFVVLIKAIENSQAAKPRLGFPGQVAENPGNVLDEHAVFGGVKRRLDTANFGGGQTQCVFGGIEVDLRYAQITSKERAVTIDVNCVFGATKIRVPDTWLVSIQAPVILGNVEDKTIRPRTTAGIEPPTLIITGQCVFGAIELEN
jgi:predicted membrane protein